MMIWKDYSDCLEQANIILQINSTTGQAVGSNEMTWNKNMAL